jgi:hypothetical protein
VICSIWLVVAALVMTADAGTEIGPAAMAETCKALTQIPAAPATANRLKNLFGI